MEQIKRQIPLGIMLLVITAMMVHGPIAQLAHYHQFADSRSLGGLPNAADVLSNIGFAVVGIWGLWALRAKAKHPSIAEAWPGYAVFLGAVTLTAIGSSFYHLLPNNDSLVWDRLPIALACAGLLAGAYAETHVTPRHWLLPALVVAAVASVVWWSITDSIAVGDLRPYLLMQGAPLVLIPLWQWIAHSPRRDRIAFSVAILLYVLAKAFELNDHAVLNALAFLSGHTIKHLLAAAAATVLVANWVRRPNKDQDQAEPGQISAAHCQGASHCRDNIELSQ
ncbi:MAG: hypothetical protein ACI8WM_003521 [Burkholderiaceae bacterium]|jgi:hypothetical protein